MGIDQLRVGVQIGREPLFPLGSRILQRGRTLRVCERGVQFSHLFGERLQFSILRFQLRKRLFMYGGRNSVALGGAGAQKGRAKAKCRRCTEEKAGAKEVLFHCGVLL